MFNKTIIDRIISSIKLRRLLPKDVKISASAHVDKNCVFEGMNSIYREAFFRGKLGLGSYIGEKSKLAADIGRFVSIAPHVKSISGTHPYTYPFVSTSPCFFSPNINYKAGGTFAQSEMFSEKKKTDKNRSIDVTIGNDCWIGEEALLIGGIKIGDGAIVLARAVVTKNVPDYAIVGGIPAKIIGYRYDEETTHFLQKIKWWDNEKNWFVDNWTLLTNINNLKDYYKDI